MEFLTKEQIVDELYNNMDTRDKQALWVLDKEQLSLLHHGFGTHIRNTYGLWDARNPLVYDWFYDCAHAPNGLHKYMEDGVDCHPQHPDQVSQEIIQALYQKVKNAGQEV